MVSSLRTRTPQYDLGEAITARGLADRTSDDPGKPAGGKLAIGEADPAVDLESGYRFVRLIGQGAHSRVYLAERVGSDLTLVLKVMGLSTILGIPASYPASRRKRN